MTDANARAELCSMQVGCYISLALPALSLQATSTHISSLHEHVVTQKIWESLKNWSGHGLNNRTGSARVGFIGLERKTKKKSRLFISREHFQELWAFCCLNTHNCSCEHLENLWAFMSIFGQLWAFSWDVSISKSCNFEAVSITSVFKTLLIFPSYIATMIKIWTMNNSLTCANAHYTDVLEIFSLHVTYHRIHPFSNGWC